MRRRGWLLVAPVPVLLAGCFERAAVRLEAPGTSQVVTCYGDDHLILESGTSLDHRGRCVAACQRFEFSRAVTTTDDGGLTPRLNPGTPPACL